MERANDLTGGSLESGYAIISIWSGMEAKDSGHWSPIGQGPSIDEEWYPVPTRMVPASRVDFPEGQLAKLLVRPGLLGCQYRPRSATELAVYSSLSRILDWQQRFTSELGGLESKLELFRSPTNNGPLLVSVAATR